MVPILHIDNTCSIYVQYLDWRQKWIISVTVTLSAYNGLYSHRRSNDKITHIEMTKIFNSFFSIIDRNSNPEEIILILNCIHFLFIKRLIIRIISLKYLNYGFCITKKWAQNECFIICETFWITVFLPASILMIDDMGDNNFSELFDGLFLFIFNMDVIFVTIYGSCSEIMWSLWKS